MSATLHFLKLTDVIGLTKKSRSSLYAAVQKGQFPAPIKIGPRASAWLASDIAKWQESCVIASKAA